MGGDRLDRPPHRRRVGERANVEPACSSAALRWRRPGRAGATGRREDAEVDGPADAGRATLRNDRRSRQQRRAVVAPTEAASTAASTAVSSASAGTTRQPRARRRPTVAVRARARPRGAAESRRGDRRHLAARRAARTGSALRPPTPGSAAASPPTARRASGEPTRVTGMSSGAAPTTAARRCRGRSARPVVGDSSSDAVPVGEGLGRERSAARRPSTSHRTIHGLARPSLRRLWMPNTRTTWRVPSSALPSHPVGQ